MSIVAIVGRPNVGKSSIFNRIVGRRVAIVDDFPGVTRDRLYGEALHDDRGFYIVDTGGIMGAETSPFLDLIEKQVALALDESSAVIFVIDGRDGVTPMDEEIADQLRRGGRPIVVAVNKLDNPDKTESSYDAYELGFENVIAVSAEHNFNIDELLDIVVSFLPDEHFEAEEEADIPVTFVGRPNVGKSSLLNAFVGVERSLVSDVPGTTRDIVDSIVDIDGVRFRFIDTAGLRRKSRVNTNLEYYSTVRTYQAIDECRVAVVLLDATDPVTEQDKRLIGHVLERGRGLIIAVNKWDLMPRHEKIGDEMKGKLADELPFASYAPTVYISANTKRGIGKLPELIKMVDENRRRRLPTSELNRLVREVLVFERMPGDSRGRSLKISFCTQADGAPPAFVFFVNDEKLVTKAFERRVGKIIRSLSDFRGVPIRIFFRNKN